MIINGTEKCNKNVSDLAYLSEIMGGKKDLIKEIMDVFLKQIPEELQSMNEAIAKTDYAIIKNIAHTMKSSVSIMGVSALTPVLQEMEDSGAMAVDIEKIKTLNLELNLICKQAIEEVARERRNYN